MRQDANFKEADLINELTRAYYDDLDLVELFTKMVYDEKYKPVCSNEHPSDDDKRMSELLDLLNSLCYYIENGTLKKHTIANTALGYLVARVSLHAGTLLYVQWVDKNDAREPSLGSQAPAFGYLRKHANEIIRLVYPAITVERLRKSIGTGATA